MIRDALNGQTLNSTELVQTKSIRGIFELTYCCGLDCVHCYCKGSEDTPNELSLKEIKDILVQLVNANCLEIVFSGGEPVLRPDFNEIYWFAKKKGLVITIFSSAYDIPESTFKLFERFPPALVEITLNAVTESVYEKVTQTKGALVKVMRNINRLLKADIPLVLKSNGLTLNAHEITAVKDLAKKFFGKTSSRFRFDPLILPRLNGDISPCSYRLDPEQIVSLRLSEPEFKQDFCKCFDQGFTINRDKRFLYQCSTWQNEFFIDPFGSLKFCQFSRNFSSNLRKTSFSDGFAKFKKLTRIMYADDFSCRDCPLRALCFNCPAKARLEAGNEERKVEYFCKLAKAYEKAQTQYLSKTQNINAFI